MKKIIVRFLTGIVYFWGCIWYDKKYFVGKNFDRNSISGGWKWILKYWFPQKVLRRNAHVPFPVPSYVQYSNPKNIDFHPDDMRSLHSMGCYFQANNAKLKIRKGTKIAPNCGFITTNHNFYNLELPGKGKEIDIGENCWIGMNCMILPGVKLANHIIVGAGSVVTKSFDEENIIIAGNPAKKIKDIPMEEKTYEKDYNNTRC